MIYTEFLDKLTALRKLRMRMMNEINADLKDISSRDFTVLNRVCHAKGGLSMSSISESTGLSNALITSVVDNLESRHLVRRTTGNDRRSYIIKATKAGEQRYKDIESMLESSFESFFGRMDRQDVEELESLLEKLNRLISKYA